MSTIDGGHYGTGVARRTKRLWTDEEKRSICFQTTASGVSVAQVALRYAVNANLIFKWRRDPRYAPDPVPAPGLPEGSRFLSVEVVAEARAPAAAPVAQHDQHQKPVTLGQVAPVPGQQATALRPGWQREFKGKA